MYSSSGYMFFIIRDGKLSLIKCEINYFQCLRLHIMLPMQGKDQQNGSFKILLIITRIHRDLDCFKKSCIH